MAVPVKLSRIKSRAKARGRPKYRYVLRWPDPQTGRWQQETCRTSDRKAAEAMRRRKFAELNGLAEPAGSGGQAEPALSWEELEERTRAALASRGRSEATADGYLRSVRAFRDLSGAEVPG